ncbi:MAG: hypothetical protein RJB13_738 [Pseudomonadota bacterium]|jgi:hypothetical protein
MNFAVCRAMATLSLCSLSASSFAEISLGSDLWSHLGVTGILQGGGRGHVADSSAVDSNPAGLAMQRSYTVSGDLGWMGAKGYQAEAAACDSTTSELAACIKFRQTQRVTGARDRRYSLGLAEAFEPLWGIIIGLGVDYVEFSSDRQTFAIPAGSKKSGQRVRLGVLHSIAEGIFVGATSEGLYDSTDTESRHGVGVSARIGKYYLMSGDLDFSDETLKKVAFGLTVFPQEFLDLALSYGYDPRQPKGKFGFGAVVKSQQARLIYSLVQSESGSKKWRQAAGIGIFMVGETVSR